jgi:hypothetical protein
MRVAVELGRHCALKSSSRVERHVKRIVTR